MPEPEPEPEPVPIVEPELDEPSPEPPTLVALPEPEDTTPEPEPSEDLSFRVVDTPALPDYVVDAPDEAQPVVVSEPEPEPDLSGPLPEFVVEPSADAAPPPVVEPEPEEEEDLGPLPDYVIDPSNPRPAAPAPQPPTPEPRPVVEARRTDEQVDETPSQAAGIYFPPVTAFPTLSADREEDEPRESRRTARPRPAAELGKSKTEPAEPGDEPGEVGWMAGLSNRLSAYSLSEDEAPPAADSDDDETS